MRDARQEQAADRRRTKLSLEGKERQAAVRRFIAAWKDLSLTMRDLEARFPSYIREEGRHGMDLETLRLRG